MLKRAIVAMVLVAAVQAQGAESRVFGVDVSLWQGTINWTTVANGTFSGGKSVDFAFIRSSRGSDPNGDAGFYSDPKFVYNITNAKANGLKVAPYHYARPDLNNAVAEAQYFLSVAGDYMVKGNIKPVLDLESGAGLTVTALTDWAVAFCNEIVRVKGADAKPIIYLNSNYAKNEVDSRLASYPLWIARPTPSIATLNTWDMNTQNPVAPSGYANPYGVWYSASNPEPWAFWQYYIPEIATESPTYISVPGIPGPVDLDVVNNLKGGLNAFMIPEPSAAGLLAVPVVMLRRRKA